MAPSGSKGFTVPYPNITLHAISRTDTGTSIYCQIDQNPGGEVEPTSDDGDVVDMIELTLMPSDPTSVEPIFEALSNCASLHPDSTLDDGEDDDDDDAFLDASNGDLEVFGGTEEQELSEVGRAALAHLESIIQYPENFNHQANGVDHVEDDHDVAETNDETRD